MEEETTAFKHYLYSIALFIRSNYPYQPGVDLSVPSLSVVFEGDEFSLLSSFKGSAFENMFDASPPRCYATKVY